MLRGRPVLRELLSHGGIRGEGVSFHAGGVVVYLSGFPGSTQMSNILFDLDWYYWKGFSDALH